MHTLRAVALLSLLGSAEAHADDVLWYYGHGGTAIQAPTFEDVASDAGVSFDQTDVWPSDLSNYQLIVLSVSETTYSASETTQLQGFMSDGGVLVLIGEHSGYSSAFVSVFNTLLSDLGASSTYASGAVLDTGCGQTGTVVGTHRYGDNVGTIGYAATGDLNLGSNAQTLIQGHSGQPVVAVEGDGLVLSTDAAVFNEQNCALLPGNRTFMENLLQSCADEDADGFTAMTCGGDDCDDTNPLVFPGALEVCDGVDEDCDLRVDENPVDGDRYYFDMDEDGWGEESSSVIACQQVAWTAEVAGDCDDEDGSVSPSAEEQWYDGVDQDCDGASDYDADRDGFDAEGWGGEDCDDDDAFTYPGAADRRGDGVDHDCDGRGGPDDDEDGDGLTWREEQELGTSDDEPDADGDGLDDGAEQVLGTDPLDEDTDDDGLLDGEDPNPLIPLEVDDAVDTGLEGKETGGCGCASTGAPLGGGSLLWILVGARLVWRRREAR